MAISEQDKLYGVFIVDFVNAETTDQAGLAYLDNVPNVFDFPSKAVKKAREQFKKTKNHINSLSGHEKKIFEVMLTEHEHFCRVCELMEIQFPSLSYGGLDIETNTIIFETICYDNKPIEELTDEDEPCYEFDISESSKDYMEEVNQLLTDYIVYPEAGDSQRLSEICENIEQECKAGRKIEQLKKSISEGKYREIRKLKDDHYQVLREHKSIEAIQFDLREMLQEIITTRSLANNEIVQKFLDQYKVISAENTYLTISKGGIIIEKTLFKQDFFNERAYGDFRNFQKYYEFPIIHAFVKFFKNPDNLKYLKQCEHCPKYFIAKRLTETRKFCSRSCKNKFYNAKRTPKEILEAVQASRKNKKDKVKTQTLNQRLTHMVSQGWAKEEALEILREEAGL